MKALIGDIGRHALHDGPGIRTTVFFKGCNLRCPWCHNPEFIRPQPEVLFSGERCIDCGDCLSVCPEGAIENGAAGVTIHRHACSGCGMCADICPSLALTRSGRWRSVDELMEILLRDRRFYAASGGGVTFSGGEPTLCMDYLHAVLKRLRREKIHTVLQTNGDFTMPAFTDLCMDFVDVIYFDLKIAGDEVHRSATGRTNRRVWSNLAQLCRLRRDDVLPRIPLIPGYTANKRNLQRIGRRLKKMGFTRYSLLPYHPFGLTKAAQLGLSPDPTLPLEPMSQKSLERWHAVFNHRCAAESRWRERNISSKEVNHAN